MNTLFNILKDIQTYPHSNDFSIKDLSPFETRYVSANDDKDAYEVEFSFAGFSKNQINCLNRICSFINWRNSIIPI